eukprot:COSAG01_NODE_3879_length_5595_cov_34.137918_5_plen_157_part_00
MAPDAVLIGTNDLGNGAPLNPPGVAVPQVNSFQSLLHNADDRIRRLLTRQCAVRCRHRADTVAVMRRHLPVWQPLSRSCASTFHAAECFCRLCCHGRRAATASTHTTTRCAFRSRHWRGMFDCIYVMPVFTSVYLFTSRTLARRYVSAHRSSGQRS